jgi:multiple sugar transport system substrate-binding protein
MKRVMSLLLAIFLFAACAPFSQPGVATPGPNDPDTTAEPTEDGPVTISYAAWEGERAIYEGLAQKFTAENPNINVVIVSIEDFTNVTPDPDAPPETPLSMLRRVVSGADTAPAMFVSPEAYGTSLLYDMTTLIDADASFKRDDFYPGALERYNVNGGMWVLPRYTNVQVLSYNKDLFKLANLPEPKAGDNWNDLAAAAEQIAKKNGRTVDTYGMIESGNGGFILFEELKEQGIDLFNTPSQELQLDRPEIVSGVERIRQLADSGALFQFRYDIGDGSGTPPEDPQQLVRDGKVGIWSADMIQPVIYNEDGTQEAVTYDFEVGKIPAPILEGFSDFGGVDGYMISGGTANPEASWKWIEFLSRQQTEQVGQDSMPVFFGSGRVPARQSLAEEIGFWNDIDEETAAAYRWALENQPKVSGRTPDYAALGVLSEALSQVMADPKLDVQQTLADAQTRLEEQLASVQLTPTPEPDTSPVFVTTPVPNEAPEGATVVKFGAPGYTTSNMRRVARQFADQNPDVFIQVQSTDSMTMPMEFPQIAEANDCFTWWGPPQNDEEFGALLDLQPLIDADASFAQNDIPSGLLSPFQKDSGLYGLPYAYNARTLAFNRTMFEAAGIETPTYTWTRDDFLAAAKALTSGEGDKKRYGYVPTGGAMSDIPFFASQFGAQITTGSGENIRPNYADPKVIEAIQWYIDLANQHQVMPEIELSYKRDDSSQPGMVAGPDDTYQIISEGRAGMWFDYGFSGMMGGVGMREGSDGQQYEVGIAPLPIGDGGLQSSDFSVRGFHISKTAKQSQLCWNWIKFLSSDVNNLQGEVPARISVLDSEEYATQSTPEAIEMAKVYAEALAKPVTKSDTSGFWMLDTYWLMKAIDEAVKGEADLGGGLTEAQKTTEAFVDCMKEFEEPKPATCANRVDPEYQGYNTEDPSMEPGVPLPAPRG